MAGELKPLDGIHVLDFTAFPPGGACTVMLADLGADVIRVESPALKGKPSLVVGQIALSRGKRSMTLDLRNPASSEILKRLSPGIDIVVENAKPGAMEGRGFGYPQACEANPAIIWCAITGFGQDGPNSDHAGHDLSYVAHSGLLGALSAEQPWHPGIALALQAGALSAVAAIQAALIQRGRTGKGAFIDLSLSEAAGWFLTCGINPLSDRPLIMPVTPDRRLYACADGRFVAIACSEPRTWAALCDHLGMPELKDTLHRAETAPATTAALAAIFLTRPAAEWVERLAPAGAAVTMFNHAGHLLSDPHIVARGSIAEVAGVPVPASPLRLATSDGCRTGTATAAPHRVGEDTEDVLAAAGFEPEDLAALARDGLI